jgi:hypothetical protein
MFETLLTPDALMDYLAFATILLWPFYNMFKRAGFAPIMAFYLLAPYAGLFICLGYLALKRWPNEPLKEAK